MRTSCPSAGASGPATRLRKFALLTASAQFAARSSGERLSCSRLCARAQARGFGSARGWGAARSAGTCLHPREGVPGARPAFCEPQRAFGSATLLKTHGELKLTYQNSHQESIMPGAGRTGWKGAVSEQNLYLSLKSFNSFSGQRFGAPSPLPAPARIILEVINVFVFFFFLLNS